MRNRPVPLAILLLTLAVTPARAELRRVEMKTLGMD